MKKSSSLKSSFSLSRVRIAIVMSRFNEEISRALLKGARKGLIESGIAEKFIEVLEVPGAFEIPLVAQTLAKQKKVDGVICLGVVIRGDTPHFDYVCLGATEGVMQAQLQTGVPMAFGVLTTDTIDQALARARDDSSNKGYEAAKVVLEIVQILKKVRRRG